MAVDDFGTGEGTLSHLQLLPIDILKLDQRFVGTDDDATGAAAAIVAGVDPAGALARPRRRRRRGQRRATCRGALLALGCRRGQGNALAEADGAGAHRALLAASCPGSTRLAERSGVG